VRGGDLHAAGTELGVDVVVGDHRDGAAGQRQLDLLPDQVPVAFVLRVHRDRRVAEHGLGPGRRHDQVPGAVGQRVAEVPQRALFLLGQHFEIRDRGVQHRVPVDQSLAAVDQAFLVQAHEDLGDRVRQSRVHREALARPVDGIAEPAHLAGDRSARVFLPLPDGLQEVLATEIVAAPAFGGQPPLDHHLRGDAGVVGAALPQRRVAAHAPVTDQRVHQRVLERVPHVQRAGHVRRRQQDAVGRGGWIPDREAAAFLPAPVQVLLDRVRVETLVHDRPGAWGQPRIIPGRVQ
jgi:hypothetical protein